MQSTYFSLALDRWRRSWLQEFDRVQCPAVIKLRYALKESGGLRLSHQVSSQASPCPIPMVCCGWCVKIVTSQPPSQANQHGSTARVDAERRHLQNSHCSPVSSPVKTGCTCLHPPYLSGSLEQLKTEFHAAHPRKRRERPPFWAPNLVFPIRSAMDEAAVPLAVRVELLG